MALETLDIKLKQLGLSKLDYNNVWKLRFRYNFDDHVWDHYDYFKERDGTLMLYTKEYLDKTLIKELKQRDREMFFNTPFTRLKLWRFRVEMFLYKHFRKCKR